MPRHSRPSDASRAKPPRGYLALTVRNGLLEQRLRHTGQRRAEAVASRDEAVAVRDQYQQWYLAGAHILAGVQGELAAAEAKLARLEAQAAKAAPVVSGWKVDLDAALEENAALRTELADLKRKVSPGAVPPLVPSPVAAQAALYRRLAAAAPSPVAAAVPAVPRAASAAVTPVVPLRERKNAS